MSKEYKICQRCIMDTTDPDIEFDENGICNHCRMYDEELSRLSGEYTENRLHQIVDQVKEAGRNKSYDCVLGLSGGVDSSYAAYWASKFGLRPLAVHLDNGWDCEVAVGNIEKIVKEFGWTLYTHVIDWEEFKDLQLSFLKASVVDIEMLTDHAIIATLYKAANERKIKYIITGSNTATELILPRAWVFPKTDARNIRAIHKSFGKREIRTFPMLSLLELAIYRYFKKILSVPILNYVPYSKKEAKTVLENEVGWRDYGGKHYESVFTRFYQAYILPTKFNIDKRKAHLSSLICSGQITRGHALEMTEDGSYLYTPQQLQEAKEYFLKKMGLSEREFEDIMSLPVRSHTDYPSQQKIRTLAYKAIELAESVQQWLY